jgi:hypothetical protein
VKAMKKIPIAALALAIFIYSAAAEPIKLTDGALEMLHGGQNNLFSFHISIYPDGSAVVIQNGAEYRIAPGSTLSLPDGTQVRIAQNINGSTLLVTNSGIYISGSVSVIGGSVHTYNVLLKKSGMYIIGSSAS